MATNVHLTNDLEHSARACVQSGRFNNVSEVVRAGLRLLQDQEEQRTRFLAMIDAAKAEAEAHGYHSVEDALAVIDRVLDDGDDRAA